MTTRTVTRAMAALAATVSMMVAALNRAENCPFCLWASGQGHDLDAECPIPDIESALAVYRAAPKLTREQVKEKLALVVFLAGNPAEKTLGEYADQLTDALLPLLEASGAIERETPDA